MEIGVGVGFMPLHIIGADGALKRVRSSGEQALHQGLDGGPTAAGHDPLANARGS